MRRLTGPRRHILAALSGTIAIFAMAAPPAAAATTFGASLSGAPFPSNAYPGQYCDHELNGGSQTYSCTWIEDYAYNNNGLAGAKAPRNGTIRKIKLVAGHGGSFKLYLARYKPGTHQGKVVTKGPKITYATDPCDTDCSVQTFTISPLTVHKGDFLAIKANKPSFLRCDSGGNRIALFKPPLAVGAGFTAESGDSGCYMLLQAVYG
jgi:hypothetical protein